jgi:excisionase family DNA binding protein
MTISYEKQVSPIPAVMSMDTAAEFADVGKRTIERAIANGHLKANKVGRYPRILANHFLEWLEGDGKTQ